MFNESINSKALGILFVCSLILLSFYGGRYKSDTEWESDADVQPEKKSLVLVWNCRDCNFMANVSTPQANNIPGRISIYFL